MKKVSELFLEQDRKRVAQAIAEAEQKTSAEIVVVAATASGRYDRAEDIVGFVAALVSVTVGWLAWPALHVDSAWGTGGSISGLLPFLLLMVAGFVAGSALASRVPVLRLPFIPRRELEEEVQRGAQAAFMSSKIRRTAGGTGILLYVSFYEHRVVVLPDDTILEKCAGREWGELCAVIISAIKNNRPTEGLEQAIKDCGDMLAAVLPRQDHDTNELSNELILIE
jgi:putative membrane protein